VAKESVVSGWSAESAQRDALDESAIERHLDGVVQQSRPWSARLALVRQACRRGQVHPAQFSAPIDYDPIELSLAAAGGISSRSASASRHLGYDLPSGL